MSNPTPSPSGTPVASSPPSPPPPSTTTAPSQTPPSTPPSVSPPPPLSSPPAPPPSAPPPLSSPPPPALSSPPPPPVSASAPAPSSPSATSSPPPTPSSVASPPPPQSSTPSPPSTASSPPSSVASPPPPKSSTPSPPSTATSPPPPTSSGVASPPPPKNSTPSSSTSPPPPLILASPPPPPVKSTTTTPSTSTSSPPSPASSISGSSVIAIGVAGVLAISVIAVLLYCLCKKKKKKYYPGAYYGPPGGPPSHYKDTYDGPNMRQQEWCSPSSNGSDVLIKIPPPPVPPSLPSSRNGYDPIPPAPNSGGSPGLGNSKSWFTYGELATATGGFSKSNMLGEGGFGCVYKGVLTDGQLVAVKQLKVGASQGEKEFQAEVEIISRVHHRHLVSLVGYCIAESQRLLVYDYVPNGTLEYHLYKKKEGPFMDWATRIKIACGAARGLAYLHEDCHPRIIHRDIKSSNILLDSNFEAQVSDFGLAKLTSDTNTHVTTRVMGTFGYLAPEYASSGKLTDKSDVFSFGVVLLELLTGRKPVDPSQPLGEESLVEWARPVLAQVNSEEDLDILADPSLNGVYDPKEMMRMVEAAAACVRHSANKRPRMGQVVRALEDDTSLSDLNKDLKPGHSSMYGSSFTSTDYDNANYSADMRRFRRVALESQEYSSGATSEYGVNPSVSSSEYQTSREIDRNPSQLTKPMSVRKSTLSSNSNEFSTRN